MVRVIYLIRDVKIEAEMKRYPEVKNSVCALTNNGSHYLDQDCMYMINYIINAFKLLAGATERKYFPNRLDAGIEFPTIRST